MADKYLIVTTTCPDRPSAIEIAHLLVQKKLAACVQISAPITSVYLWQDEIHQQTECSLQIKCLQRNYAKIEKQLRTLHPYEVPEIIATEIVTGSDDYLDWIKTTSL